LHFHGPKIQDYKRYLQGSTYTGGALQSATYWANLDNVAGGHTPFEFEALVATSRRWRPVVVLPVDRTARERAAAEAEAVGRWERFDERPPIVIPAEHAEDARVYVWRQWSKSYFSNCGDHCANWVAYYEKWTVPPSRVPWLLKVGAVVLIALVLMRRASRRRGRPPLPRARVERRASSASPMRTEATGRIRRRVSSDQALPNAYD